ncbi:hypothetical protein RB298_29045 [Priestia sp. BR_2]
MSIKQPYLKKLERIFLQEGITMHGYDFELSMYHELQEIIERQPEHEEFKVQLEYEDGVTVNVFGCISQQLRNGETPYIETDYEGLEFINPDGTKKYHKFEYSTGGL